MTPKRHPRFLPGSGGQAGPGVIAITGAAGPAGRALVRSLLVRMSETAGSAPTRVIAIDTPERIERLMTPSTLAPAPEPSLDLLGPGLEYASEIDETHPEPTRPAEPFDPVPGAAKSTDPRTDAQPTGDEPTDTEPTDSAEPQRPRRRSYLPSGLTALTPSRREAAPKETKETKEQSEPPPSVPELGIVPGTDTGVDWRPADISSPDVVTALDAADVVIHLSTADDLAQTISGSPADRRLRVVRTAQAVSMAAAAVGARRFVSVTSAMVLGARPDNPLPLSDDASCRADPDDGLVGDLLEVERVLERIPRVHPGLAFTLIRPAALVGPGVDTAVTRHFEAPRLLVLRGTGTQWQFCHVDDLAEAIWTAVTAGIGGPLTVGAAGSLDEAEVEAISGMRRLEVPAGLAFSTAERLHRVGVLNTPAGELAYVVHPWVIGSAGLLAAGWEPRHDNETCLRGLLDDQRRRRAAAGRRVSQRDAAMGAAGAAVALLGTAAIVRQARSRQSKRRRSTLDP